MRLLQAVWKRMELRSVWMIAGFVGFALAACSDTPTVKTFECQDNKECKNAELCQSGKCVVVDDDKDGWAQGKDCNDSDPSVYPGRREICDNGKDDNCDGQVDEADCVCAEGSERSCGLAVGECRQGKQACLGGEWGRCTGASEPTEEICDAKDNDCDGTVDEGVLNCCLDGERRPCGDIDQGECKKGSQTCLAGQWGRCEGESKPTEETCDGLDNDCDGKTDNLPGSSDPLKKDCYTGPEKTRKVGACVDGYLLCKNGQWEEDTACRSEITPTIEICDGLDNDCDGQIDTDPAQGHRPLQESCFSGTPQNLGKGPCKEGIRLCTGGRWGACQGEIAPSKEICDGLDNDCDGSIDEDLQLGSACQTGFPGVCGEGTLTCANTQVLCKQTTPSSSEICDGKDNDCDGTVDETFPEKGQPCTDPSQKGECSKGSYSSCSQGTLLCTSNTSPVTEVCGDGLDNDCDGKTDENPPCECSTGQRRPCYSGPAGTDGVGLCAPGEQLCISGLWGLCANSVLPSTENCDGKDNDCDGKVDEGNPGGGATCPVTAFPPSSPCRNGLLECKQGTLACSQITFPVTEKPCNGIDDDCNGSIDEVGCLTGFQCKNGSCGLCTQPDDTFCQQIFGVCLADAPCPACACNYVCRCQYNDGFNCVWKTCKNPASP